MGNNRAGTADAYMSVPNAKVEELSKFFLKALPIRHYRVEPCSEPVMDNSGMYAHAIAFLKPLKKPLPEPVAMGGVITVIRGDAGNAIALVKGNQYDPACDAALTKIGFLGR